jgi:selenium-binding protein 1
MKRLVTNGPNASTPHCGLAAALTAAFLAINISSSIFADETCVSPYMTRIEGQEDYVYVWTLGIEGLGDGSDKLVTVDVNPKSSAYGKVIHSYSVGGRHEAHHGGFTDDRKQFWLAGLDTSKIFVFDVHSQPSSPQYLKTISDLPMKSGGATGPHGAYALPGRMLIPCLSNNKDLSGRTALVEYTNEGEYLDTHWMPTKDNSPGLAGVEFADGYGYDARALPRKNVMLSSSFAGSANYMRPFSELVQDASAMKNFGQTLTLWDFHARKPKKVFHVPGAPLEVRWAWGPKHNYAFTATALTSKLWLVYEDTNGEWQAKEVGQIGGEKGVFPVDISLSADDRTLFVGCFSDGKCRVFDVSDPHQPKQIQEQVIGRQVNMVSQSWDGKRLYFTSSLLAKWDKQGDDDEQFLRAYHWNGRELEPSFSVDFTKEKLGRPHAMNFGSTKLQD